MFLVDKKGAPVSAEGLFGGTKYEPKSMGIGEGYYIQEDNVAAEYNIPPCASGRAFTTAIGKGLQYINKVARKNDLKICLQSALHFDPKWLATPHAQTLGCEPDFDIWALNVNARPNPPKTLRTAAGHIHVSWADPTQDQIQLLVRALDLYLGVPSILVTNKNERRSLYGRAGAFRPKDYGVEYRTLDNFWVGSPMDCQHIYSTVTSTIGNINLNSDWMAEDLEDSRDDIQQCINNYDKDMALMLLEKYKLKPFPIFKRA